MNTEIQRDIPKTCNGLFLWIEKQKNSHDLKTVTATNWLGACKKLFLFDDAGWEQKDPSEMDFGLLCDRALNAGMNSVTVTTYRTKAKEAIKNFLKYLDNPSAYKSPVFKGKRRHDGTSEIISLAAPAIATSPVEVRQSVSSLSDRHIHFHIHLSGE
jgi:hypothetical protein